MGVCTFCSTRLVLVDYYGLHLCGCVNCNTWEHNGVPAAMAPDDCAALREQTRQELPDIQTQDAHSGYVRGRDKFKRDQR